MWVRGLKPAYSRVYLVIPLSHPMWVRGLKLQYRILYYNSILSHPMWVRGLKLCVSENNSVHHPVAPYVGAWIETTR